MMKRQDQFRIHARLEEIAAATAFVKQAAQQVGLSGKALHSCQLAVDEACTNIVEHSYQGQPDQVIDILCIQEAAGFIITVMDDGPPFDPLKQSPPDPEMPLDHRKVGGWGVYLIKQLMDAVTYEYLNGRNHLRMTKRLPDAATPYTTSESDPQMTVRDVTETLKVVTLAGRIDPVVSDQLEQLFLGHLKKGHYHLILDMRQVEYISSSGLKMLVSVWKRARDAKGDLVLAEMPPGVLEILKLIGFDLVFTIFESLDAAVARYQ